MKSMRLDKILSSTGIASRKQLKGLIREGRVSVCGSPVLSPDEKYDPEAVSILVDGIPVEYKQFYYVMLHKPAGVVSATEDPREATVIELLPEKLRNVGLFPVGRLDKDTEGLLLLTNDGQTAYGLTAPKKHVDKNYFVRTDSELTPADSLAFRQGITLSDGYQCMPAELKILPDGNGREAHVTLREGKFHQVKRMLLSRGKTVLYLKRLSMGELMLDPHLLPGQYRELNNLEIEMIKNR